MPHYQINNIIVDTEPETDDSDDSKDLEALIQNLYESDEEGKELLIPDFINEDTKENVEFLGEERIIWDASQNWIDLLIGILIQ